MNYIGVYEHGTHYLIDIYPEYNVEGAGNCVSDLNLEYYENNDGEHPAYYLRFVSYDRAKMDLDDMFFIYDGYCFVNNKQYDDIKEAMKALENYEKVEVDMYGLSEK